MKMAMKNFHVPLPENLYKQLRLEANKSNRPATELARNAIEEWLGEKRKNDIQNAIIDYAKNNAGTNHDIDKELENITIECINNNEA